MVQRSCAGRRNEAAYMKNFEVLSEDMLCMVWGGAGFSGGERPTVISVPDTNGHGKTEPGGNEDIFAGE